MAHADSPNIVFYPPVLFATAPVVAVALEWLLPIGIIGASDGIRMLGFAILIIALTLGLWGIAAFKREGTNVSPHTPALVIVTNGPYRMTRNPMYLGIALFQLGLGLAFSLDWAVLIAPLALLALHFGVVLREEVYLTAKFGAPYTDYLNRTRRWI